MYEKYGWGVGLIIVGIICIVAGYFTPNERISNFLSEFGKCSIAAFFIILIGGLF